LSKAPGLTLKDLAGAVGVSVQTARRLLKDGDGQIVRVDDGKPGQAAVYGLAWLRLVDLAR